MTPALRPTPDDLIRLYGYLPVMTAEIFEKRMAQGCGLTLGDLISAGNLGLVKAARSFDASRGVGFATFAICLIRGEIREQLRRWDWVPRAERDKIRAGDAEPVHYPASLESKGKDTPDGDTLMNLLVDDAPGPEAIALKRAGNEAIAAAIDRLPERERASIVSYYFEGLTHKEVGVSLGVSESRAYQLWQQAVKRLRGYLQREAELFEA